MDVNYEEDNLALSPPLKFIEPDFLKRLLVNYFSFDIFQDLTTPEGMVTFNLLCYDKETKDKVFGMIAETPKSHKFFVEGEEDVNRVIILTKSEPTNEDLRQAQMEKVCKEWSLNKGLWLNEMRIKQKIDKIQEIK